LILRYAFFAVLATMTNLAMQRVVLSINDTGLGFAVAVGVGTIVGLVIKYFLDKRWIFYDTGSGLKAHGQKFSLYTYMGVITTCIFWGTETAFWLIWQTDTMRELGAVLGLTFGYVAKYNLDRRFVFIDAQLVRGTNQ
jgi:putative flippase GtrA